MNKIFSDAACEHYLYWQLEAKKNIKKINELIRDIERNGNEGLGKPEPLKHELSGYWSRRITEVHRLIYSIDGDNIYIASCKNHYVRT
jgi:toxin YoeB